MIRLYVIHPDAEYINTMASVLVGEADLVIADATAANEGLSDLLASTLFNAYDLVLVDFGLPDGWGLRAIHHVASGPDAPPVLVTGMTRDVETALYWIEEGAAGYVCDSDGWAELVKTIRAVHAGEFALAPEVAAALMNRIAELQQLCHHLEGDAAIRPAVHFADLTPREREVLHLIAQEQTNQQIAEALVIELGTVKNHVHNLLRKLDVGNRQQAAQVAQQMIGEMSEE